VRGVGRGKAGGVPGNRLLPRPRGGGGRKGRGSGNKWHTGIGRLKSISFFTAIAGNASYW
jgi:hypothetical protein